MGPRCGRQRVEYAILSAKGRRLIYRDFSQAQLDEQYNNLARIPDHEAYVARWAADSERYRSHANCRLDIAYGDHPRQRLDLFFPGDSISLRSAPIHAFVHGGYWYAQAKENFSYVADGLTDSGIIVAVIEYALCPEVLISEIVRQVRSAMSWLWFNAGTFGGDPQCLSASGHSAGAHLVAMSLATDWPTFDQRLPINIVTSGVTIGGVFDLEPIRLSFLNETLGLDRITERRESPMQNLPSDQVSLVVMVGSEESSEFIRQSNDFASACIGKGIDAKLMVIPDHHHISVMDEFRGPNGEITAAIKQQVERRQNAE